MSDQPDAETCTGQQTTSTRYRYPCPQRNSEPTIPARERPQTNALDFVAIGIGMAVCLVLSNYQHKFYIFFTHIHIAGKIFKQKTNFKVLSECIRCFGILNFGRGKCGVASTISARRKLFADICVTQLSTQSA